MSFRVTTDLFRGPIDLLLFLVRRHELDVAEIPLAEVAQQFDEYLQVLKEIDIDRVGEFVDVASLLIEMKSREVLPRNEFEEQESYVDPRTDLVQRLLLYKKFKDAASLLEEQALRWQRRYRRLADDLPTLPIDYAQQPLEDVELWDLVSAFGRVLRDNLSKPEENIFYDETPIQVYMRQVHQRLIQQRQLEFTSLFHPGMHKSTMVGIFLAVLELTRHHNVLARQDDLYTEIIICAGPEFDPHFRFDDADSFQRVASPAPKTEG
jgi:segregation and condensation protein A